MAAAHLTGAFEMGDLFSLCLTFRYEDSDVLDVNLEDYH
jgi:hypothetical protein